MKKKHTRLYNMFFPVWLLFAHPALIAAALPINFGVDLLVILWAMRSMQLENKKEIVKSVIWRSWGFGFAADIIGAVLLFILSQLSPTYTVFGQDLYLNPFRSITATLIMIAVVALVGGLIYLFNRKLVYNRTALTDAQQKRICLFLAIVTAPYLFFVPTIWFV